MASSRSMQRAFVGACAGTAGLGLSQGLLSSAKAVAAGRPPNVLMAIGEDMMGHDCQPCGSRLVETPNMQRLADAEMRFEGREGTPDR